MKNVNAHDLVEGALMALMAIYFLLGLFSNAPWLHTDGRRKSGRLVVTPTHRFVRIFCVLAFGYLATSYFADAFHHNLNTLDSVIDIVLLAGFGLLYVIGLKKSKKDDDTVA